MIGKKLPPEEYLARALFGAVMVLAALVPWGKWVTFALGVLFLASAFAGGCVTCVLFKKYFTKPGD